MVRKIKIKKQFQEEKSYLERKNVTGQMDAPHAM